MDKQRQIDEIPQGGIVNDSEMLSLGYCHNDSILSKGQCKGFKELANRMSNVNIPTINSSGAININFEYTPDAIEEIVKNIIDELAKKV